MCRLCCIQIPHNQLLFVVRFSSQSQRQPTSHYSRLLSVRPLSLWLSLSSRSHYDSRKSRRWPNKLVAGSSLPSNCLKPLPHFLLASDITIILNQNELFVYILSYCSFRLGPYANSLGTLCCLPDTSPCRLILTLIERPISRTNLLATNLLTTR